VRVIEIDLKLVKWGLFTFHAETEHLKLYYIFSKYKEGKDL